MTSYIYSSKIDLITLKDVLKISYESMLCRTNFKSIFYQ